MTALPPSILRSDLLNIHSQRLSRIIEECLDVAFILCNSELEEFGIAKIFDIFNQIITTAFVLNTGFWPFFNTVSGQCLCVCGRYGMSCRHLKNVYHWIDLQPIPIEEGCSRFYPKYLGTVFPLEYNIQINAVNEVTLGYNITINLKLQYKKTERGRPRRQEKPKKKETEAKLNVKQIYVFTVNARYNLAREYYSAFYTIVFQPNPFFHEQYGSYFTKLVDQRSTFQWPANALSDIQKYFTVAVSHMPTTSLMLTNVNVPVYCIPVQLMATFPQVQPTKIKYQRIKRNKSVQTPWLVSTVSYEQHVEELKEPVGDSDVWRCEEDQFQSMADSIKKIEYCFQQDEQDYVEPEKIENSNEYDSQLPNLGFDRTVKNYLINEDKDNILKEIDFWMDTLELDTKEEVGNENSLLPNNSNNQGTKRKLMASSTKATSDLEQTTQIITFCGTRVMKNSDIFNKPNNTFLNIGGKTPLDYRQIVQSIKGKKPVPFALDSIKSFPFLSDEIFTYNINNDLNYSEALKKLPERKILPEASTSSGTTKEFKFKLPSLPRKVKAMSRVELDDEFDIIEEVIKEDVLGTDKTLDWWFNVQDEPLQQS